MARARNIKPGFFTDAEVVECSFWVRLLFAGLWTVADKAGRLKDRPKQIKIDIFPNDAVDVGAGLDELETHGLIVRYEADGERYIQVKNFSKHQTPHKEERESTIPAPEGHSASAVQIPEESGANPSDTGLLIADALIADSGLLGEGAGAPAKPRTKRATQVPTDWVPEQRLVTWALDNGFTREDVFRQTPIFVRHHRSKGNVFKDIGLAWQNWMERSREYGPARASPPSRSNGQTTTDLIMAAGQRVKERHEQRRGNAGAGPDRVGVWQQDAGEPAQPGTGDRGLDDRAGGRAVDAVWRAGPLVVDSE